MTLCVEMRSVYKRFGRVVANRNVDFQVKEGEIHSLVGGNGAGKSTLMKILYGMIAPDSGELRIRGVPVQLKNSRQALRLGIGMVQQEFQFVEEMDAIDNIILGDEPAKWGIINRESARRKIEHITGQYHLDFKKNIPVSELSVGERQRIEIVKMLFRGSTILILDEPTGVLTPQETRLLFQILRRLKDDGSTIIFISHKLHEVLEISDSITVMRGGLTVLTVSGSEADIDELSRSMIGEELPQLKEKVSAKPSKEIFVVKGLSLYGDSPKPLLEKINLSVRSGEIVGIAGVEGNGQKELEECFSGLRQPSSGEVWLAGKRITQFTPRMFRKCGTSIIPSMKMGQALISRFSLYENVLFGYHTESRFSHYGIFRYNQIFSESLRLMKEYDVQPPFIHLPADALSGGNQQRLVLARELSRNPKFLIAAHPTRGIDIKGTHFIHTRLLELKEKGTGIILISADLDELFFLCDQIAVIFEGKIVKRTYTHQTTLEEVGFLMMGGDSFESSSGNVN